MIRKKAGSRWLILFKPELVARTTLRCLDSLDVEVVSPTDEQIKATGNVVLDDMRREYRSKGVDIEVPTRFNWQPLETIGPIRMVYRIMRTGWPTEIDWCWLEALLTKKLCASFFLRFRNDQYDNDAHETTPQHFNKTMQAVDTVEMNERMNGNTKEQELMRPEVLYIAPLWARKYKRDLIVRTTFYYLNNDRSVTQDAEMRSIVTMKGHELLQRLAVEYYRRGEIVTVSAKWKWKVREFALKVVKCHWNLRKHWPEFEWRELENELLEHIDRRRAIL